MRIKVRHAFICPECGDYADVDVVFDTEGRHWHAWCYELTQIRGGRRL
jgi:hypothetical protein